MNAKLEAFQKLLKFKFNDQALLQEALTHKSFSVDSNRGRPHNERLEFLGDSILNFVIADELLKLFPEEEEGTLSKKRASLVNWNKLSEISKKYALENHIEFGPGEIKQGSHLNERIQGSCIEAIIGAIHRDSGIDEAKKWVLQQYQKQDFFAAVGASFNSDFKSRLQELTQKHKLGTPVYEVVLSSGPSHKPRFLVCLKVGDEEKARAEGASKKAAEQKAAEIYLSELIKTLKE